MNREEMREKREFSRKIGVKSLFTFPLIDYFHTHPCCSSTPTRGCFCRKRVLWKFNQKNSHILRLLLDYISTFWSFVYFRNSAAVSTHARRSNVESTRESSRGIIFLIFRRFQQQKKMFFLIDFWGGIWVHVKMFSRLGFFFHLGCSTLCVKSI